MAEAETSTEVQDVAFKWMQIAKAVARGGMEPEEGIEELEALAEAHPTDRQWLLDEIETIRVQFGLDVTESIRDDRGTYWDKLGAVMQALLDERLDHKRALELLRHIDARHPEHKEQTAKLVDGIAESPLRRYLDSED
jgi:hypothetical protein